MKTKGSKTNWIIDAVLFGGFILAFFLNLTGVELHQWIGIFGGMLAGYHLLVHWAWVKGVARRLADGAAHGPWRMALVDALVFTGLLGILVSGLVISTWLNLSLGNYAAWRMLHIVASLGTLSALVVKIGLHWRWIMAVARRFVAPPASHTDTQSVQPDSATQPIAVTDRPDTPKYTRREFVKLMGGVGVVTLLAAANVLDDVQASSATTTTGGTSTSSTSTQGNRRGRSSSSTTSSASGCIVQCNRGCSFPGHCRRYVDANNNNRCDLSECAS